MPRGELTSRPPAPLNPMMTSPSGSRLEPFAPLGPIGVGESVCPVCVATSPWNVAASNAIHAATADAAETRTKMMAAGVDHATTGTLGAAMRVNDAAGADHAQTAGVATLVMRIVASLAVHEEALTLANEVREEVPASASHPEEAAEAVSVILIVASDADHETRPVVARVPPALVNDATGIDHDAESDAAGGLAIIWMVAANACHPTVAALAASTTNADAAGELHAQAALEAVSVTRMAASNASHDEAALVAVMTVVMRNAAAGAVHEAESAALVAGIVTRTFAFAADHVMIGAAGDAT